MRKQVCERFKIEPWQLDYRLRSFDKDGNPKWPLFTENIYSDPDMPRRYRIVSARIDDLRKAFHEDIPQKKARK